MHGPFLRVSIGSVPAGGSLLCFESVCGQLTLEGGVMLGQSLQYIFIYMHSFVLGFVDSLGFGLAIIQALILHLRIQFTAPIAPVYRCTHGMTQHTHSRLPCKMPNNDANSLHK